MTSAEVMEIVAIHLSSNTSEEALVLSQRDIAISIIDKLVSQFLDEGFLNILKITAEIHGELSFFSSDDFLNSTALDLPVERLKTLLSMYSKFKEIIAFLHQHYENLDFGEFSKSIKKEDLKKILNVMQTKYDTYDAQFRGSGTILFYSNDISAIRYGIDFARQIILGKERFIQFMKEFNDANRMLKQIQAELLIQDKENTEEN